ncbi:hypothetical protein [Candidatus Sodalis sp. SoCistrobi]|uniref:hypothetical protein n=1 Tax=Candidatus Sodalis sp. SoCistrobi TaxID=1922216 RepID=UPI00093F1D75|nr:hypothetical protein [Candidatus Sodalis sp. SoCistrobi]
MGNNTYLCLWGERGEAFINIKEVVGCFINYGGKVGIILKNGGCIEECDDDFNANALLEALSYDE